MQPSLKGVINELFAVNLRNKSPECLLLCWSSASRCWGWFGSRGWWTLLTSGCVDKNVATSSPLFMCCCILQRTQSDKDVMWSYAGNKTLALKLLVISSPRSNQMLMGLLPCTSVSCKVHHWVRCHWSVELPWWHLSDHWCILSQNAWQCQHPTPMVCRPRGSKRCCPLQSWLLSWPF